MLPLPLKRHLLGLPKPHFDFSTECLSGGGELIHDMPPCSPSLLAGGPSGRCREADDTVIQPRGQFLFFKE